MDTPFSVVRKLKVRSFYLAQPTFRPVELAPSSIAPSPYSDCTWLPHPSAADIKPIRFTILVEADGSPWIHGNLYLLNRAMNGNGLADATLEQIAADLADYRNILANESTDYLLDHRYLYKRPTQVAKRVLQKKCESGFSEEHANRILGRVVDFYEWIRSKTTIRFNYELYSIKEVLAPYQNDLGYVKFKKIRLSSLKIKRIKDPHKFHDYIFDGEKLRPLFPSESQAIIRALSEIGNQEMYLGFLISLVSGARIQTVFTLRSDCLRQDIPTDDETISIAVGRGTHVDTKYGKRYSILIPGWLHNKIKVYLQSNRAQQRRANSKLHYNKIENQYIFLTKTGDPYYISSTDPNISEFNTPPNGGAVRKFISQQLLPKLRENGHQFKFRFHYLRATFGMSLVRVWINKIELGEATKDELLAYLMMRLGQSSIAVALQYLNYKFNHQATYEAQVAWEKEILSLANIDQPSETTNPDRDQ